MTDLEIPRPDYLDEYYLKFHIDDEAMTRHHLDLIGCFDGLAQCYVKLKDPVKVRSLRALPGAFILTSHGATGTRLVAGDRSSLDGSKVGLLARLSS